MEMSKPSLRLQLTKLVLYHILLWQLGRWPQSKFHCRAAVLPVDEVSALRAFMSNLELRQELFITNMFCSEGVSYYGFTIECDCVGTQCRISKITISNLGLTGTIHEGVGYLSNLKYLSLFNNKLHGSIPDSLGNLGNLKTLDLSKNQLSGSIPASLGDLGSLQWLYLQYNLLSGGIPQSFGSLKKLQEMNLQFNMLSGSIPEAFGALSSLTTMDLSENKLSGPLPESLKKLSSLTTFLVSANYLSEEFPKGYDELTSLKIFSIAGNSISGPLPVNIIAKWTRIKTLVLVGNNFNGSLTKEIFDLKNLQYLLISDLANDGNDGFQLPPKIANSANFISLTLRNCKITGPIPQYIGEEMTALRYLDLSFNNLTGGLPRYMKSDMIYMSFSGNKLNGKIPHWIFTLLQTRMDLSFNNFSAIDSAVPSNLQLNLFACCGNSSATAPELLYTMDPFEMKNIYCPENKPKYHSLFINCGGEETTVHGNNYDQDNDTSPFYTSPKKNWAYSLSGDFGVAKINSSNYIKSVKCGVSITEAPLFEKARLSPQSLRYYAFCLRKGKYNVTLHFREVVYTEDADYTSLRKRAFDVFIQDKRRLTNFDIKDKEGSTEKPIIANFSAVAVDDSGMLKIHLDWRGKGSFHYMPSFNGPLISAISVTPEFKISTDKYKRLRIALITIASIIAALLLLLAFAWWMGWLPRKELPKIKIGQDKFVTVKELIYATGNFSDDTKRISGTVYKADLQDTSVVVKRLISAHFNEKIEELKKEVSTIRSLQHENVLKLWDVYIEKDHRFLVYEYMEKKSLADNLFAAASSTTSKLKLNWKTRVGICLGIAKGLKYLHEHPRVTIVHGNIKSANILLNENLEAKISDFGYATLYTEEDKVRVIGRESNESRGYMAPEYFLPIELTSKADVYSFGVVVLEIVSGKKIIYNNSKAEAQMLIDKAYQANKNGKLMNLVDKNLSDYDEKEALIILKLALKCTRMAAPGRPTMSEVVSVLREKSLDKVFPPANLTGDVKAAGSTSGELTSVTSTSQFTEGAHDHPEVVPD